MPIIRVTASTRFLGSTDHRDIEIDPEEWNSLTEYEQDSLIDDLVERVTPDLIMIDAEILWEDK